MNRYISVQYKLYTGEGTAKELVEETTEKVPFTFLSGFGIALKTFEKNVIDLQKGEHFNFVIPVGEAYGVHDPSRIIDLEREMFCIDGKFDSENVYVDAVVPLQDEEGTRFFGRVLNISGDKVTLDMNHPLAGQDLNFIGYVQENREATEDEINGMIRRLSGGCHCGGGCKGDGGCGGGDDSCSCGGSCGDDAGCSCGV